MASTADLARAGGDTVRRWMMSGLFGAFVTIGHSGPVVATTSDEEPKPAEPTAAVRQLLAEINVWVDTEDVQKALALAESGLAMSRSTGDRSGEAFCLRSKARLFDMLGRSDEATIAWRDASEVWQALGELPEQIEALTSQAFLIDHSKPDEALALVDTARRLAQSETRRPLATAAALHRAASVAYQQVSVAPRFRLPAALALFESALSIRSRHIPDSLEYADTLRGIGAVLARNLRTQPKAKEYFERALPLYEKHAPNTRALEANLYNLGMLSRDLGDNSTARNYLQRALAIVEAIPSERREVANCLEVLGMTYVDDDPNTARAFFERALTIRESLGESRGIVTVLTNLGAVADIQGDLSRARHYHERALEVAAESDPASGLLASILVNLGAVATKQGDFISAKSYYTRALPVFEANSMSGARTCLHNLGSIATLEQDYAAATTYLQRALADAERVRPDSAVVARELVSLGTLARLQGDFEAAEKTIRRALDIHQRFDPESQGASAALVNLGLLAKERGDLTIARQYVERAVSIVERISAGSLDHAHHLNTLGFIMWLQGDRVAGKEVLERAWTMMKVGARAVSGDEARTAYGSMSAFAGRDLLKAQIELGDPVTAFVTLEESRGQALLQMLALRGIEQRLQDPSLWTSYKEAEFRFLRAAKRLADSTTAFDQAKAEVEASGSLGQNEHGRKNESLAKAEAGREAALSEYTQKRQEMEKRLAAVREAVPGLRDDPVPLEDARSVLPPDALWVSFAVGEGDTVGFLVPATPGAEITAYVIPIAAEDLAAKVESFVDKIRSRPPASKPARRHAEADYVAAGRELYGLLFPEKIRPMLDRAVRLMISPDGVLWDLPFSALVVNEEGPAAWLGIEKSLSLQQSLSAYVRERETHLGGGEDVLIVGNPDFGGEGTAAARGSQTKGTRRKGHKSAGTRVASPQEVDWSRGERARLALDGRPPAALPGAEKEARELASLYRTKPLIGLEATEPAVRGRLSNARVVHLATHGYFHPTMPMASGVLLTPPRETPDEATERDGVLQAYEFTVDLGLKADLVVLSACETGRGKQTRGEGLIGLTRSLQMAGARSIVATHWRIADWSSGELMKRFHRELQGGKAKDDAMRVAMTENLRKESSRAPYFWAAFFVTGQLQTAGSP